jgi:hypothetical protein
MAGAACINHVLLQGWPDAALLLCSKEITSEAGRSMGGREVVAALTQRRSWGRERWRRDAGDARGEEGDERGGCCERMDWVWPVGSDFVSRTTTRGKCLLYPYMWRYFLLP